MYYLFFQIWVWLVAAFILGWLAHWFLCCRGKSQQQSSNTESTVAALTSASLAAGVAEPVAAEISVSDDWKPLGFSSRPADVDDLKRIKGVGGVLEETLNTLGIYQFSQIAEWSRDNVAWVDNFLSFPGRIDREDWINQAKTLASGGTTSFANRVDKGEVDYD